MGIIYDSAKRDKTLDERGLDFELAAEVFAGMTLTQPDLPPIMASNDSRPLAGCMAGSW